MLNVTGEEAGGSKITSLVFKKKVTQLKVSSFTYSYKIWEIQILTLEESRAFSIISSGLAAFPLPPFQHLPLS